MGAHHARTIAAHPGSQLVACIDVVAGRAESIAMCHGALVVRAVPDDIDIVVVATPTTTHVHVAMPLLERGLAVLVEKPLAATGEEARAITALPGLLVGHIERFNPAVRALGDERFSRWTAWRINPPSDRCQDVDAISDLMVHDIDLALQWGGEVRDVQAEAMLVEGGRVEAAVARLVMADGEATLLVSRRGRAVVRRVLAPNAALDLARGECVVDGRVIAPPDDRDALTAQWDAVLAAMKSPTAGLDPLGGLRAVDIADRIRDQCLGCS